MAHCGAGDRKRARSFLLFDNQASTEHSHRACKWELPWLLGQKLDGHGRARRQVGALAEIGENHLVRARGRLLAPEIEAHRLAMANHNGVGRIPALHEDHRLLVATGYLGRAHAGRPFEPEEPDDEADQAETSDQDEPAICRHDAFLPGAKKRSRLALVTTVTELKAIAAAAISGDRRTPNRG